jgi:polyisoprenoid-binding protein YceI
MTTTANPIVTWKIDLAHSRAEFKVKHMMISNVKGTFSVLDGTLIEDTSNPTLSHVDATIDIGSINTGDEQRDTHLKSADFFHHEQHPKMTFHSTGVETKAMKNTP